MSVISRTIPGRLRFADLLHKPSYGVANKVATGMFFGDVPKKAKAPLFTKRRTGAEIIPTYKLLPYFDPAKAFSRRHPSYRLQRTHFMQPGTKQIANKLFFGDFHVDFLLDVEVAEAIDYPLILQENITTHGVLVYAPPDGAKLVAPPFGVLFSNLDFIRPKPFMASGGGSGGGQVSYGG